MDREALENLIADKPKDIKARGVLLFNGVVDGAATYQKAPTAANLRDWEAAQAALAKFAELIGAKGESDKPLMTRVDVADYLIEAGWKVSKPTVYKHCKEGKLIPRSNGAYSIKDVEKYARTFLKQQSTGKRVDEELDRLQRRKEQLEVENLELDNKRKKIAYERDQGRYIPREQMELEMATRAGVLDAGLKHLARSRAAEYIRLVGGDMAKIGILVSQINRDLDEQINHYAAATEYDVVIDAREESWANEIENGYADFDREVRDG